MVLGVSESKVEAWVKSRVWVVVASKCAVVIKRGFLGFLKLLNVSVAIGKSGHREEL